MSTTRLSSFWSRLVFRRIKKICFTRPGHFYGTTSPDIIRSNDTYEGLDISFSSPYFDPMSDTPPTSGDIICGIPHKNTSGLFFTYFFTCPYDFLYLWTLVVSPFHPALYYGSKPKTKEQILSELSPPFRQMASLLLSLTNNL